MPLNDADLPDPKGDAQTIAIYIAQKLIAASGTGNVSIGDADTPVTANDVVIFKGTTGKKIYDSGFTVAQIIAAAEAGAASAGDARYQRGERRVLAGETRTVPAHTSDYISGPFEIQDTGILEIEDDAVLEVG